MAAGSKWRACVDPRRRDPACSQCASSVLSTASSALSSEPPVFRKARQSSPVHHQYCLVHRLSSALSLRSSALCRQSCTVRLQPCPVPRQSCVASCQSSALCCMTCLVHIHSCLVHLFCPAVQHIIESSSYVSY